MYSKQKIPIHFYNSEQIRNPIDEIEPQMEAIEEAPSQTHLVKSSTFPIGILLLFFFYKNQNW